MAPFSAQLAKSFLRASTCRRTSLQHSLAGLGTPARRWITTSAPTATAEPAVESEPPVKEKRGRKPKDEKLQEDPTEEPESVAPKKRGRKPKVEKVYEDPSTKPLSAKVKNIRPPKKKVTIDPITLHTSMTELPPENQWSYFFPYMKETQYRSTIRNPETARMVAEALVPSGSRDKIIIEAYPGAGLLTRALLALPKRRIKKLFVIEDAIKFIPFLKPLEGMDSRVKVITKAGKQWTTYADMENDGDLDEVSTSSWDEPNDQLQFIMQVALDTHGEQLIAQLLRAMPDRQWLFKYGRIPMNLVLTERMWERIKAPADTLARCKVSVMGQAVATFQENVPPEALQPHGDHFYPYRAGAIPLSEVVVTITPRANSVIPPGDLDLWDYCLRKLFVMRATPLEKCIGGLGPGAKNILPKLTDPSLPEDQRVDIEKSPRRLDIREWALIINAFKNWPFRPTDLSIETFSASRH